MMLLAKSGGAADPKKIRIVEAEYRAEKGFSRPSAGFANSIKYGSTPGRCSEGEPEKNTTEVSSLEIRTHTGNRVNRADARLVEDAMSRPFGPGMFCPRCYDDLHGAAYRVSFIGEPTVVSTPVCEACFPELDPDGYAYAKRVEVRRG